MTAPKTISTPHVLQQAFSPQELEKRTYRMAVAFAVFQLLSALGFAYIGYYFHQQESFILAGFAIIGFISLLISRNDHIIQSQPIRVFFSIGMLDIFLLAYAVIFQGASLPAGLAILAIAFLISSTLLEGSKADSGILNGIVLATLAAMAGYFKPLPQISTGYAGLFGYAIFVGVLIAILYLFQRKLIVFPLRLRLITIALLIVILPVTVLSVITNRSLQTYQQNETNQALENSATLFAQRIDEFVQSNRGSVAAQAILPIYSDYLNVPVNQRADSAQEEQVKISTDSYKAALKVKERTFLTSIAILDMNGQVAYTSNRNDVSRWDEKNTTFFRTPIETGISFASDVLFSPVDKSPNIFFSAPIRDAQKNIIGVLRIKFDAAVFQQIAKEYAGSLDEASYPILFDEDYVRLAQPYRPQLVFQSLVPLSKDRLATMVETGRMPAILRSTNMTDMADFLNHNGETRYHVGWSDSDRTDQMVMVQLKSRPWSVVYLQDQSVLLRQLEEQTNLAVLIAAILAAVVSLATMRIARVFSDPITELTNSALEISNGNMTTKKLVKGLPEFQLLGKTFDTMAAQIQQIISSLEDRVQERTRELGHQNDALMMRAKQFETVADVARGVASAQELEELLNKITVLVSERFGFQHAGIFLLDNMSEYAILRAASSEGGKRMLERQHRLQVGQSGIVGYVTSAGEPRIATDVGQDAVYFNNPDLPLTRSEMALPLKVGQQIIGALDVQSNQPNAFSEEDIQLFSILADQVAIAIYNNKLYGEMSQALAEAQMVHRRYLEQEWSREEKVGQHNAYRYFNATTNPNEPLDAADVQSAVEFGEPVATQEAGDIHVLTVPVKLRGETIAVIRVQETADGGQEWHSEEVETVKEVADQVALALENARLFMQSSRRAERERKVLEITSKIRQHNDPQTMLQVAVEELQNALRASRAQVVLQPRIPVGEHGNGNGNNGNGHNGNHGKNGA